ncbi:MAG: hypothetical protein EA356_16745, partial [Geminicoccaceae bacterium]
HTDLGTSMPSEGRPPHRLPGTNFPARKQRSDWDLVLERDVADDGYLSQLEEALPRLFERHRPDLAFYNAGVDPHRDDRLGHLALSDEGLQARDHAVLDAARLRAVPLVGVIGGGYDRDLDRLVRRHALLHRTAAHLMPR